MVQQTYRRLLLLASRPDPRLEAGRLDEPQPKRVDVGQYLRRSGLKIDSHQQRPGIEAEIDVLHGAALHHCHRTTLADTFFFSSRRRHTRWTGDWSSDVCSSD